MSSRPPEPGRGLVRGPLAGGPSRFPGVQVPQATSITVTVRFLARYAEVVGREAVSVTAPAPATVESVLARLEDVIPSVRALPPKPLCARNFRQVRGNEPLLDGDELALLPPMAGG